MAEETLVTLGGALVDVRGSIQPLVERVMRSAMYITSKKGAVRGNHYHKTDWHYCYMVSGAMEYYYRPTGSSKAPELLIVKTGQMVFTPPRVDHAMKFLKDTAWLTLSRNPRTPEAYESDVVRIHLIGP
jgi:quercetin dioxygenase-like cupin family protein